MKNCPESFEFMELVGIAISEHRDFLGLTQAEYAKAFGVDDQRTLSKLERGVLGSSGHVGRLMAAGVLKITVSWNPVPAPGRTADPPRRRVVGANKKRK